MKHFEGKVAVVTGAASGIGLALAKHAVSEGMQVVMTDINSTQLEKEAATLRESGANIMTAITDVSQADSVAKLADDAFAEFGHVDILMNNAGILISGLSWERSIEDWERSLNINLYGVINCLKSFVPRMHAQQSSGHIVNTSSLAGLLAAPFLGPYTVSKQAVLALTETLHYELESLRSEIKVSALCPGPVATGIADSESGQAAHKPKLAKEAQEQLQQFLAEGVSKGQSSQECAKLVFQHIRDERFWIFTHEDFKPQYQRHSEQILRSENPHYAPFVVGE